MPLTLKPTATDGKPVRILFANSESRMTGPEYTGHIAAGVVQGGGEIDWIDAVRGAPLPADASGHDGLVLTGGELSVFDEEHRDLVNRLCDLYLTFRAAKKPVLGSCLGAQIMARALGARVERMECMEFGFSRMATTAAADNDPVFAAVTGEWQLYEGHRDRFEFPDGAVPLMIGEVEPSQVFRVGSFEYGFQCHFEATRELVIEWTEMMRTDLAPWLGDDGPELVAAVLGDVDRLMSQQDLFARRVMAGWMDLFKQ